MIDQLIDAWLTNNRINVFLLDHISDEGMQCTLSAHGGRNVSRQFAHLHNVRVMQIEARAKDLAKGLKTFATKDEPGQAALKDHLNASADRVAQFLRQCAEGKRKAIKKGVVAMLGYFIAHESHHRGSILLTLKQCGHPVDQDARFAIWDWDKM